MQYLSITFATFSGKTMESSAVAKPQKEAAIIVAKIRLINLPPFFTSCQLSLSLVFGTIGLSRPL